MRRMGCGRLDYVGGCVAGWVMWVGGWTTCMGVWQVGLCGCACGRLDSVGGGGRLDCVGGSL